MKEDMGVADEMALLVLESRMRSLHNCARTAPERTYLQFMVARSDRLQQKGMQDDMGVVNKMGLLVLGSCPCSSRNCARSVPDCTYLQFMVARCDGLK